jgi:spore coat protein U-like protein
MFKRTKTLLVGAFLLAAVIGTATKAQVSTDVYLTVIGGQVTIGQTGSLNFGDLAVSTTEVVQEKQFSTGSYFRVEDMKGADA